MTVPTTSTTLVPTRLGRLAVRTVGEGPTAVLWPSMFVDSRSYDRVAEGLAAARRLVLVDGPGWGASDPLLRTTTIAECALAAQDLLDGLGETGPVDWVGNAWGGHVGYRIAGTSPGRLRSLVAASSPTFPLPAGRRRQLAVLAHVVQRTGIAGPLRGMVAQAQLTDASRAADPGAVAVLTGSLAAADRRSQAASLRSFIVARTDLGAELARARVPVLLLAGDDRGDLSPEQARAAAATCRDARVVVVPGARTLIPVERPDGFTAAVLAFWAGLPTG
ncbi:alpha/beta fold hydrolase [Kineococcus rubinsiae]|uniref:alpha/beta fold hydrolase n=1 Tax=Kineococcus rubinsiae TaxID=2609562 RepID=UPI00143187F7|nr:alpha/beta hydrolase [Kineococcus rubinsiae]NIZ91823.1 alpha/beta hydrolase [Kineococcus rubinsiae]